MRASACRMRSGGRTYRRGDWSSPTASAYGTLRSKTGSPVPFSTSATMTQAGAPASAADLPVRMNAATAAATTASAPPTSSRCNTRLRRAGGGGGGATAGTPGAPGADEVGAAAAGAGAAGGGAEGAPDGSGGEAACSEGGAPG